MQCVDCCSLIWKIAFILCFKTKNNHPRELGVSKTRNPFLALCWSIPWNHGETYMVLWDKSCIYPGIDYATPGVALARFRVRCLYLLMTASTLSALMPTIRTALRNRSAATLLLCFHWVFMTMGNRSANIFPVTTANQSSALCSCQGC